ncbi:MAG: hypothetical protein ACJAUJ_001845 [Salibacteraceae bacterium]|jgi:hypothetical protein
MVFQLDALSQRKKKNPYEGYWEQQEKQEQFDKVAKEAHLLFQDKKFIQAKNRYQAALNIIPTDQRVIAKIRDINLLLEKRKQSKIQETVEIEDHSDTIHQQELPDTLTLYLIETKSPEVQTEDTFPGSVPATTIELIEKPVIKTPKVAPKKPVPKKAIQPKTKNTKPTKNTENYRKHLATKYKSGWTEEKYNEGKKEIIKRVFVQEKYGEEYLMVKHHYGAVYYFKNGASISYATWIAETEKKPK